MRSSRHLGVFFTSENVQREGRCSIVESTPLRDRPLQNVEVTRFECENVVARPPRSGCRPPRTAAGACELQHLQFPQPRCPRCGASILAAAVIKCPLQQRWHFNCDRYGCEALDLLRSSAPKFFVTELASEGAAAGGMQVPKAAADEGNLQVVAASHPGEYWRPGLVLVDACTQLHGHDIVDNERGQRPPDVSQGAEIGY